MPRFFLAVLASLTAAHSLAADVRVNVWPDLAPGETTRNTGELMPFRESEVPRVSRVINITQPSFSVHLAPKPAGAGVVILPGGGFDKVVPDKEGTEAAEWLNRHGITAFVLSYRTKAGKDDPGWARPLQDAQRTLSLVRAQADRWGLKQDRIGLLGFSAGGQVAARLLSAEGKRTYARLDDVDDVTSRPDFALLIYPWNIYDRERDRLVDGVSVPKNCPPSYIVHTGDDKSSSLGAVLFYVGLKKLDIPAELHVYGAGGHGYGLRPVPGSQISTWPDHAAHWLSTRGMGSETR